MTDKELDRYEEVKNLIKDWDELAKDNENNKHNLSTSERQDWEDEFTELKLTMINFLARGIF